MTDPTNPQEPVPPASSGMPPAPGLPPQGAVPGYPAQQPTYPGAGQPYAPGGAPKQTLSLVGFILGIVSIVLFWSYGFGTLVGIAGIIVSVLARRREPAAPGWMKTLGLVLSIVGAAIGVLVLLIAIIAAVALVSTGNYGN